MNKAEIPSYQDPLPLSPSSPSAKWSDESYPDNYAETLPGDDCALDEDGNVRPLSDFPDQSGASSDVEQSKEAKLILSVAAHDRAGALSKTAQACGDFNKYRGAEKSWESGSRVGPYRNLEQIRDLTDREHSKIVASLGRACANCVFADICPTEDRFELVARFLLASPSNRRKFIHQLERPNGTDSSCASIINGIKSRRRPKKR